MKRLSRILVFIVLVSCSGNTTSVRHKTLDAAERLMQARPDSALGLLCDADTTGFTRADRAKYALLLSQALDKNYIDLQSDSVIRPAVEYYSRHGHAVDRAWTYYYLARIHTNAGNLEAAIRAYVSAENYATRTDDYNLRGLLYANMGKLYYSQYNLNNALQMYTQSIEAYRKTNKLCNLERSLFAIAQTHYLCAQYAEAADSYSQARTIAIKQGDSTEIARIDLGIAATLLHNPVTPDLDTVMQIVNSVYGLHPYQPKDWPLVCYYYFKTGQLDSTRRYAAMIIDNLDNYSNWKAAGAYQILENCGQNTFSPQLEYYRILDSLQAAVRKNFVAELDKKYKCDNILDSYTLLKRVHKYQTISTILVLVVIVILIFELLRVSKRNIDKRTEALNNAIKYIEELRENYSVLNNRYNLVVNRINASDANATVLIDALRRRIESLQELIEDANVLDNNPKAFMAKFKDYISSEYDRPALDSLCSVTNVYGYGIVDYLRNTYPRLSNSEIQMCCLLCLGFSSSCIRYIFNHRNSDSIYAMRFRLRAKLGLNRCDKLETFLMSLMEKLSHKVK